MNQLRSSLLALLLLLAGTSMSQSIMSEESQLIQRSSTKKTETLQQSSVQSARAHASTRISEYPTLSLAYEYHKNARGKILNFVNRQWLVDIYADNSDRIVVPKASKTGITEWLICNLFSLAKQGLNGMYVLPDQPIRNRFISSRIDPIIGVVPEYREAVGVGKKDVDEKSLKTIYTKSWAFVGAKNPDTFYEYDSDINIYDERDKIPQLSMGLADDRLGAATQERWRKVGNPSIKGYGIDKDFQETDQKHWLVRCEHCNEFQELKWFDHFVEAVGENDYKLRDPDYSHLDVSHLSEIGGRDARAVCHRCSKPFDRLGHGEWVAKHEGRPISGYHITRLFGAAGNDNGSQRPIIIEEFKRFMAAQGNMTMMQLFWNNRLGQPYEASGSKVTESDLMRSIVDGYIMPSSSEGSVVGGIDVGGTLNIKIDKIINGKRRAASIGTCPLDLDEATRIVKLYGVQRGVIDGLPETRFSKDFVLRNPGWYRCFYSKQDDKDMAMKVNHKERKVSIGRTESLDFSHHEWSAGLCELPMNQATIDKGEWVSQMIAPTRILKEASEPPRYVWDEGSQPDHYRHADNYASIAGRMLGQTPTITFV